MFAWMNGKPYRLDEKHRQEWLEAEMAEDHRTVFFLRNPNGNPSNTRACLKIEKCCRFSTPAAQEPLLAQRWQFFAIRFRHIASFHDRRCVPHKRSAIKTRTCFIADQFDIMRICRICSFWVFAGIIENSPDRSDTQRNAMKIMSSIFSDGLEEKRA